MAKKEHSLVAFLFVCVLKVFCFSSSPLLRSFAVLKPNAIDIVESVCVYVCVSVPIVYFQMTRLYQRCTVDQKKKQEKKSNFMANHIKNI